MSQGLLTQAFCQEFLHRWLKSPQVIKKILILVTRTQVTWVEFPSWLLLWNCLHSTACIKLQIGIGARIWWIRPPLILLLPGPDMPSFCGPHAKILLPTSEPLSLHLPATWHKFYFHWWDDKGLSAATIYLLATHLQHLLQGPPNLDCAVMQL